MKFKDPTDSEADFKAFFDGLVVEIDEGFASLVD